MKTIPLRRNAHYNILATTFVLLFASSCHGNLSQQPTSTLTPTITAPSTSTNTPTFTATITETASPTLTKTPSPLPTPIGVNPNWSLIISDTFDNNENNWEVGTRKTEDGTVTKIIKDGKYKIALTPTGSLGIAAGSLFYGPSKNREGQPMEFEDVFVSVEARIIRNNTNTIAEISTCDYGLYVSMKMGEDYYALEINEGEKKFNAREYITMMFHLNTGFNTTKQYLNIHTDSPNTLAVKAEGNQLTFYINGVQVLEAKGKMRSSGNIALSYFYGGKSEVELEFDNYQVYGPS